MGAGMVAQDRLARLGIDHQPRLLIDLDLPLRDDALMDEEPCHRLLNVVNFDLGGGGCNPTAITNLPPAPGHPQFWQAGSNAGGFDDPTWKQTAPFATFDDVLEVAGTDDGNNSM